MINGKRNVKVESGFITFKNFNKQIPVPFKIYADFECLLKSCGVGIDNIVILTHKKYQDHIPCSFAYKVVCIDNKYCKYTVLHRGKDAVFKFIKSILKSMVIVEK